MASGSGSNGQFAYTPPSGSSGATPTIGIEPNALPSFAQSEGTTPHADITGIKPPRVAERELTGDNHSRHPANCEGEANCGSTAPPEKDFKQKISDGLEHAVKPRWEGLKSSISNMGTLLSYLGTQPGEQDLYATPEAREAMDSYRNSQEFQDLKQKAGDIVHRFLYGSDENQRELKERGALGYLWFLQKRDAQNVKKEYDEGGLVQAGAYLGAGTAFDVGAVLATDGAGRALGSLGRETVGEPVSVATGEYLETWHDFRVPAALPFYGTRYMGLKLPLPEGYASPLGPCQISMFDEVFSNPEPGQLDFHQADGKTIRFARPFNFLDSRNAGEPHLDLRAPWLKRLELRDRRLIKHFRQYDDRIYRLEKIEELNGQAITLVRGGDGRLERAEGTDGLALVFENDARGHRTAITLVGTDGLQLGLAQYAYDARGRMTSADCAFGMSVAYVWDAERDLLLSWHNLTRRSQTHFTYDTDGRVLHTATNGLWNGDRFRYDPEARQTTYLPGGAEARAQRFAYDGNDNVTAETDALGHTVSHVFDAAGFRTATTDANGHASATTYDLWGNVKSHTDAEGRNTNYGWGPEGQLDIVIDGAGHIRRFEYDERANVVAETDAEGNVTRHERDEAGRVVRTVFPDEAAETYAYDGFGRLSSLTDARGGVTRYGYDVFGRQVSVTDAAGQTTTFVYEAGAGGFATPSAMVRPDGVRVSRAYAADGVLASVTDGEGRTWRYAYGAFDVLQAIEDPRGGKVTLAYDDEGRVVGVTNQNGLTYHLIRDAAGRVIAEADFDGRRTEYTRDPGGRVTETRKPDGARLVYAYDRTDKLTSVVGFAAEDVDKAHPLDATHYWYDGRGLLIRASNTAALITFERDANGRIVCETMNGRRVESRLDARGNRIERRIGEGLVKNGRDPLGALASLTIDDHAPLSFSRDVLGRETRRASAKGFRLDQAFDPVGQLMRQSAGREGQAGRKYAWDKAGAPTLIDDQLFGPARYRYDANGQVAQASFGEALTERFDYDAVKNVVGVSVEGPEAGVGLPAGLGALMHVRATPGGVVQLAYGPHGETVALTHDACGRVVERRVERKGFRPRSWRYGWDVQDRLVRCETPEGKVWHYRYDAFGRRLTKVRQFSDRERVWVKEKHPALVSAAEREGTVLWTWPQAPNGHAAHDPRPPIVGTHVLWDGDLVAEEAPLRLDGSVDWDDATRWHYEPESFVPVAKQTAGGKLSYIVTDHLGTPREMFDEVGGLRWAANLTTWGVVRKVLVPPEAANDDGWQALYPRPSTRGNLALKAEFDATLDAYACPIRFQGQWHDTETGLHYNRYRHYDPIAGQYASEDPINLGGGTRPHSYVPNPNVLIDPFGLRAVLPVFDGKTTHGILDLPTGESIPLQSGAKASEFKNYAAAGHVEGKAAIIIRERGAKSGKLRINNTNGICGYCDRQLETLLPEGSTLELQTPPNTISNNSMAVVGPKTYIGNSAIPKSPK